MGSFAFAQFVKRSRQGRPKTPQITSHTLGKWYTLSVRPDRDSSADPPGCSSCLECTERTGWQNEVRSIEQPCWPCGTLPMRFLKYATTVALSLIRTMLWPDNWGRKTANASTTAWISWTLIWRRLSSWDQIPNAVRSKRWDPTR